MERWSGAQRMPSALVRCILAYAAPTPLDTLPPVAGVLRAIESAGVAITNESKAFDWGRAAHVLGRLGKQSPALLLHYTAPVRAELPRALVALLTLQRMGHFGVVANASLALLLLARDEATRQAVAACSVEIAELVPFTIYSHEIVRDHARLTLRALGCEDMLWTLPGLYPPVPRAFHLDPQPVQEAARAAGAAAAQAQPQAGDSKTAEDSKAGAGNTAKA
jgi:hypothetical protein